MAGFSFNAYGRSWWDTDGSSDSLRKEWQRRQQQQQNDDTELRRSTRPVEEILTEVDNAVPTEPERFDPSLVDREGIKIPKARKGVNTKKKGTTVYGYQETKTKSLAEPEPIRLDIDGANEKTAAQMEEESDVIIKKKKMKVRKKRKNRKKRYTKKKRRKKRRAKTRFAKLIPDEETVPLYESISKDETKSKVKRIKKQKKKRRKRRKRR